MQYVTDCIVSYSAHAMSNKR